MVVTLDLEYTPETKEFRSWASYDPQQRVLFGSLSRSDLEKYISSLPPGVTILGHHTVHADLARLLEWGIPLPKHARVNDTLLLARQAMFEYPVKELKPLARLLGYFYDEQWEAEGEELLRYNATDAYVTYELAEVLQEVLTPQQQKIHDLYCRLSEVYYAMEVTGLKMDKNMLETNSRNMQHQLACYAVTMPSDIITNNTVYRKWMVSHLTRDEQKLLGRTSDDEIQIDGGVLESIPDKPQVFYDILKARRIQKLWSTFVKGPLERLDQWGYYHPSYTLLTTKSFRRSTTPQIQNWPAETRGVVCSRFREGKIVTCDLKNNEARLFAWSAGCQSFLDLLLEGGYSAVAEKVFGVKAEKGSEAYTVTKSTVLAIQYNIGDYLFAKRLRQEHGLDVDEREAKRRKDQFFNLFPEMKTERDRRIAFCRQNGYITNEVGMVMPIAFPPGDVRVDGFTKKHIENEAVNIPTQSLAGFVLACLIKDIFEIVLSDAKMDIWEYITYIQSINERDAWDTQVLLRAIPMLEVHDDIGTDCQEGFVEIWKDIVAYCMKEQKSMKELLPTFNAPLELEWGIHTRWTK